MKHKILLLLLLIINANAFSQGLIRPLKHSDTLIEMVNYNNLSLKLSEYQHKNTDSMIVYATTLLEGSPYVAGTLDADTINENLVVSFSKFDCMIFAETICALVLDNKSDNPSFTNYKQKLESIRYRNGERNGYVSRLHYASDWIYDNCRRGIFSNITSTLGGIKQTGNINFMSSNPQFYKQLRNNAENIKQIKQIEDSINMRSNRYYIPKNNIKNVEKNISAGSIIFFTTSKSGLDYVHTGIALKPYGEDGDLYMIHASSTAGKVVKTTVPLRKYIENIKNFSGITVLKLN